MNPNLLFFFARSSNNFFCKIYRTVISPFCKRCSVDADPQKTWWSGYESLKAVFLSRMQGSTHVESIVIAINTPFSGSDGGLDGTYSPIFFTEIKKGIVEQCPRCGTSCIWTTPTQIPCRACHTVSTTLLACCPPPHTVAVNFPNPPPKLALACGANEEFVSGHFFYHFSFLFITQQWTRRSDCCQRWM